MVSDLFSKSVNCLSELELFETEQNKCNYHHFKGFYLTVYITYELELHLLQIQHHRIQTCTMRSHKQYCSEGHQK
jgi:hypothetical protein